MGIGGDVYPERGVAVGPTAGSMAVHIDTGVHVHAFKVEAELLATVGFAERKRTAVPSFAGGQVAAFVAGGRCDAEGLLDAPVVGERYGAGLGEIAVVQNKLPPVVEELFTGWHGTVCCCGPYQEQSGQYGL